MGVRITITGIRTTFATCFLLAGGALLAIETFFGFIAMLGIGFDTFRDVALVLCLTLAFPIFLLCIRSLRLAVWALWIFFIAQWLNACSLGTPPRFISPFDWWHDDVLFLGIVLVHIAYVTQHDVVKKLYTMAD